MSTQKFRLVLLAIFGACVLVFIGLCVMGLSALGNESKMVVDLKLKNQTADAQLTNLAVSKQEVEKYSYFKTVASTVIPNDKNQAEAVLEIFRLASQSGINIQSITFPNSSLGLTTGGAAASSSSVSTPAAAATPSTQKIISQSTPVTGIPGLYSVQLIITPVTGSQLAADQQVTYPKMLDFLSRIENNRRTAQITQVNIQPLAATGSSQINFSLTVNIFIKP
jgi:hypothetical protein